VVDGLHGLLHDAVVGRHDEDDDVRHLGAARAHGRKGLVPRRVEKNDVAVLDVDVVGADGLRDAARLALDDVGLPDGVKQRRLAVVDVAHDGDDGRPGSEVPRLRLDALQQLVVLGGHGLDLVAELGGNEGRRVDVDGLVDGDHHAQAEQFVDDVAGTHAHLLGEFAHADGFGDADPPLDRLGRRDLRFPHLDGRLAFAFPAGRFLLFDLAKTDPLVLLVDALLDHGFLLGGHGIHDHFDGLLALLVGLRCGSASLRARRPGGPGGLANLRLRGDRGRGPGGRLRPGRLGSADDLRLPGEVGLLPRRQLRLRGRLFAHEGCRGALRLLDPGLGRLFREGSLPGHLGDPVLLFLLRLGGPFFLPGRLGRFDRRLGGGGGGFFGLGGLPDGQADGPAADDGRFDAFLDDLHLALGRKLAADPLDLAVLERAGVGLDGDPKGLQPGDELLVLDPELLGQLVHSHFGHSRNPRNVWFSPGASLSPPIRRCRPFPFPFPTPARPSRRSPAPSRHPCPEGPSGPRDRPTTGPLHSCSPP